jgi:hypothetical protein
MIADALRPRFPGIMPDEHGKSHESMALAAKGKKKLDINYSTPALGLGLGVSVKTLNFRDPKTNRYTKNYTRIDNELRAEAMDYHIRQPYAVLVGVLFLPADSADDGDGAPSSFGSAVQIFRRRSGRGGPKDPEELFEKFFIGLYEHEGDDRGDVRFFDVAQKPPRLGRPRQGLATFEEFVERVELAFRVRNDPPFEWSDNSVTDEDIE